MAIECHDYWDTPIHQPYPTAYIEQELIWETFRETLEEILSVALLSPAYSSNFSWSPPQTHN